MVLLFALTQKDIFPKKANNKAIGFQEKLFRWFNVTIVGLVMIYLFGQTLPLTSQVFGGEALSFSPMNYEQISAPLLTILCVVTALCPHASLKEEDKSTFWRRIIVLGACAILFPIAAFFFKEFSLGVLIGFWVAGFLLLSWSYAIFIDVILPVIQKKYTRKNNKRIGMLLIHLGLAVMVVGIMGVEILSRPFDWSIAPNEPLTLTGTTFNLTERKSRITENGDVVFDEMIEMKRPECSAGYLNGIFPGYSGGIERGPFFAGGCSRIPNHVFSSHELDLGWRRIDGRGRDSINGEWGKTN